MLIGGQAVLLHGRPRLTEDIDITVGADPGRLDEVLGRENLPRLLANLRNQIEDAGI